MKEPIDEFASWASIVSSAVAVLGVIQSQFWISVTGIACVGISIGALIYARTAGRNLKSAGVTIEGLNLDSLNIANIRRRLNRSLTVQKAFHLAQIEGRDLAITWQYEGFCRTKCETSMEFSIDSDRNLAFTELDCFAFDLQQDPDRRHEIRPLLIGGDGLSKKIAIPFLKPLLSEQPFSILLNCKLPGSVGPGIQYYASTLSFDQRSVDQLAVHLVFVRNFPEWVRVYDCGRSARPILMGELRPSTNDRNTREYVDIVEKVAGQSTRIYVYWMNFS